MLTQCGTSSVKKSLSSSGIRNLSLIPASKHQKKLSTEHSLTARRLSSWMGERERNLWSMQNPPRSFQEKCEYIMRGAMDK